MRKKEICSNCGIKKRRCNMRPHKIKGGMWCKKCLNKVPENKFYSKLSEYKQNKRITKYNITDAEKKVLSTNRSQKEINNLCKSLKIMQKKIKLNYKQKEMENMAEKEKEKEKQISFLKGLNQK